MLYQSLLALAASCFAAGSVFAEPTNPQPTPADASTPAKTTFLSIKDFPNTTAGEVPYYKEERGTLSINAGNPDYRKKFARAQMTYPGAAGNYNVVITTYPEFDGESTYRLLINGELAATYINPRVDKSGDLKPLPYTWHNISIPQGATIAIESNTASNGLIPEHDAFAWARGRWSKIQLIPIPAEPKQQAATQTTFFSVKDFPNTAAGEVPYYKEKRGTLSINAGNPKYRDKFARAQMTYPGAAGNYSVVITTYPEFDGECTYRLLINGELAATYVNPRVDKSGDLKPLPHTWHNISIPQGATIAIESNTASNGLIPEHDAFAWARGRWSKIQLIPTPDPRSRSDQSSTLFDAEVIYREAGTVGRKFVGWSLKDNVHNSDDAKHTFKKISGPDWLTTHEAGWLSGNPTPNDVGMNEFIVEATDSTGHSGTTNLRIRVQAKDTAYRIGRIALSSDGNHHDHDDWGATTASLGVLASQGLQDKMVLYVYSDHVWSNGKSGKGHHSEKEMVKSAVVGGQMFGFDTSRFIAGVDDPEKAYQMMSAQMAASTAADPLTVICAGPMQVAGEALASTQAANPAALKHVRLTSHSTWNNRHADKPSAKESAHSG